MGRGSVVRKGRRESRREREILEDIRDTSRKEPARGARSEKVNREDPDWGRLRLTLGSPRTIQRSPGSVEDWDLGYLPGTRNPSVTDNVKPQCSQSAHSYRGELLSLDRVQGQDPSVGCR